MSKIPHVGLVGCGDWGKNILRDLLQLQCRVSVADTCAQARERAQAQGADRTVANLREFTKDIDGFVVATNTEAHADVIHQLLDIGPGIAIFCEKPLTDDVSQAEQILQRAGDLVFMMHKWQYHPGICKLRKIVQSRELGELIGIKSTRVGLGNNYTDQDAIWRLAPHDISIFLEILGYIPDPKSAVVDMVDGLPLGMIGILGQSPWCSLEVSCRYPQKLRAVWVFCEKGVAIFQDPSVTILRDSMPPEEHQIPAAMPLYDELAEFVRFISGGPTPRCSASDGVAVVRAIALLRLLAEIS